MLHNYFFCEKTLAGRCYEYTRNVQNHMSAMGTHFLYYFLYKKQNISVSMIGRLRARSDISWDNRF